MMRQLTTIRGVGGDLGSQGRHVIRLSLRPSPTPSGRGQLAAQILNLNLF